MDEARKMCGQLFFKGSANTQVYKASMVGSVKWI